MFLVISLMILWLLFLQIAYNKQKDIINLLNDKLDFIIRKSFSDAIKDNNTNIQSEKSDNINQSTSVSISADTLETHSQYCFENSNNTNIDIQTTSENVSSLVNTGNNFEKIFMGNIFNKIGAVAILVGIGIFVKLISSCIEFTDVMKISLGYLAGIGMLLYGLKLRNNPKLQTFSEVLAGTGVGALLITTYCATSLMQIFNLLTATIIASLIIIVIYIIADRQKTTSMLVIGLIGGYINPFFINSDITSNFLFYYLIFLNLLSLLFVYRNPDKQKLNIFNLVITAIMIIVSSVNTDYSLLQCLILWGIYLLYDILMIKQETVSVPAIKTQSYLNFGILTILSYILFKDNYIPIGLLFAGMSIVYFVLGKMSNSMFTDRNNSYYYSFVISIFLSTYFLTDELLRIALWSTESVLTAFVALKYNYKNLAKLSFAYLVAAISNIFFIQNIFTINMTSIVSLYFLPLVIAGFLLSSIFKQDKNISLANLFKFISITLIYTLIIIIINSLSGNVYNDNYIKLISYAVICLLYSLNIKIMLSDFYKSHFYKLLSLCIYGLSIIFIFASEYYIPQNALFVFNLRFIPYFTFAGISYCLFKKDKLNIYKLLSTTAIYVYSFFEISNYLPVKTELMSYMIYVSLGLLYSIHLLFISKRNSDLYEITSKLSSIVFILMLLSNELFNYSDMFAILNYRLLAYALVITNLYLIIRKNNNEILKYLSVLLGFAYIHFESVNIVNNFQFFNINWLITFMWILYAGITSLCGIFKDKKYLKISGIWLSIVVIIRLFMFDFAGLDMIFKLLAFMTLGIVLMLVSYFYNKNQK